MQNELIIPIECIDCGKKFDLAPMLRGVEGDGQVTKILHLVVGHSDYTCPKCDKKN